ncbi:MAG TPA: Lrp/AsnC family transcriptional regulator [Pseudonocardia sp.]
MSFMPTTVPKPASNALPNMPRKCTFPATIDRVRSDTLNNMPDGGFDKTDRAILTILQREGRLANVELAERVSLSPSSCLRRTKALEAAGMIAGYRADLDRQRLGLGLTVFISLRVDQHSRATSRVVEESITAIPAVVACHVISGQADFLVEAVVPDLAAYESLLLDHVLAIDAVIDARSTFAIRTVLSRGPLPVDTVR